MKKNVTPIVIAVLIPVVSIAIALCLIYFKKSPNVGSSSGASLSFVNSKDAFSYEAYIKSPQNLIGNRYVINAQMERQLEKLASGRLVTVRDSISESPIAVLIPSNIDNNLITNQRYKLNVEILKGGKIVVRSMEKY